MSSYASAQHDRMIAGAVKACYVVAVDLSASPPVCRVSDGEWTSAWVRWHSLGASPGARHWLAPGIHEQGVLISTSGDVSQGTFLPGLYSGPAPAPIRNCPWCGTNLDHTSFKCWPNEQMPTRMLIVCPNVDCDFTGDRALPILATDDEIYRRLPALLSTAGPPGLRRKSGSGPLRTSVSSY